MAFRVWLAMFAMVFGTGCSTASGMDEADAGPSDTADLSELGDGSVRPGRPDATPPPPPDDAGVDLALTVTSRIDGRSRLIVTRTTVQWHHLNDAAPGRHSGQDQPTQVNGQDWMPVWPSGGENRNCNCMSEVFDLATLLIPQTEHSAQLTLTQARDRASIVQAPTAENGFTLILEFDDRPSGGSTDYVLDVALIAQ